ncbi:DHA2 family efflux MFS transporter permease subunit [Novosphingobium sp. FSY-8]|uniref:DHA2 family efflux MFS transporter permease subunit n=1 Tax=Novosphingobium ovatum TaxID=1908523 RepID=A0ABW9XEM2_9SPHN|nr:DHA2 family efflux MFS transporter permease subunit [Novosphingobium ovatum]NBC36971.1 DHA2 family efflux MFS transporter permease subunit [Novosphingobium ovatum]
MSTGQTAPLSGARLVLAAALIGMGNLLVVLDTTIANVSVPTIAGSLGVSASQGTWVITSYAVAEAITVPLTGWLANRFGAQRVFLACYFAFGVFSLLCGLSTSLGMLVGFRVVLGLCGGPIMPLAQTLLMRLLPPEKQTLGTVMWAMTTLIGPIIGPVLGGTLCDTVGWSWIFFIGVPAALGGGLLLMTLLRGQPDPTQSARIDTVGLGLLIVWVGALQILLDEGRQHDWFASTEMCVLAVVAALGFGAFLIWELTEKHPIVDLRVFRHRGFAAAAGTYSLGFAAFFASIVILPLWLQQNLGYTATWAGYATGLMGVFAVLSAPIVGKMAETVDPRRLISIGILGLAGVTAWRTWFSTDVTFWQMAIPTLLTGPCMVLFFVPVTGLAMATVAPGEEATAAGLSNFARTLAGAFATSIVQTQWANDASANQTEIAGAMARQGTATIEAMQDGGFSHEGAVGMLDALVQGQSVMLASIHVFAEIAALFVLAAAVIWLAPKPKGPIDTSGAH